MLNKLKHISFFIILLVFTFFCKNRRKKKLKEPKEMDEANWNFYSKTLQGTKKQRDLDERALATVNGSAGEALGKL